jgi:hypothetical protein
MCTGGLVFDPEDDGPARFAVGGGGVATFLDGEFVWLDPPADLEDVRTGEPVRPSWCNVIPLNPTADEVLQRTKPRCRLY